MTDMITQNGKKVICSVDDCNLTHEALGFCKSHYRQYKKWGNPLIYKKSSSIFTSERIKQYHKDNKYKIRLGKDNPRYKNVSDRHKICVECGLSFTCFAYEAKRRLFCSMLCKSRSKIIREKLRRANMGKKATEDTRRKLSESHSTKRYLEKMSGKNNPSWIDGRSKINQKLRSSPEYRKWRNLIMKKDDYTCQLCLERGGRLEVDHYPYSFSSRPDKRLDNDNGRTLCQICHYQITFLTPEWGAEIVRTRTTHFAIKENP